MQKLRKKKDKNSQNVSQKTLKKMQEDFMQLVILCTDKGKESTYRSTVQFCFDN